MPFEDITNGRPHLLGGFDAADVFQQLVGEGETDDGLNFLVGFSPSKDIDGICWRSSSIRSSRSFSARR